MLLHRHSQRCAANTERLWLPLVNRRAQKCTCTSSAKGTSNMQASTYFMQFMPRHTNRGLHGTCELDKMLSGGPKSAGNSHLLACTGPKNGLATPCAVDWGGKTLIPQKAPCPPCPCSCVQTLCSCAQLLHLTHASHTTQQCMHVVRRLIRIQSTANHNSGQIGQTWKTLCVCLHNIGRHHCVASAPNFKLTQLPLTQQSAEPHQLQELQALQRSAHAQQHTQAHR